MPTAGEAGPERILGAAKEVFSAKGFRGGSLNEIAQRSGYTRAGLLHHFPSKEHILLALLDRRDAMLSTLAPFEPEDISFFEMMRLWEALQETVLADRELVQLAHILTAEASGADHPAHAWVANRQRRFRLIIATSLRFSARNGELPREIDADRLAEVVFGVIEGVEGQWLIDPAVDPRSAMETVRRLIRGLDHGRRPIPTNM